ncbi:phage tail assembly protein [Aureimonas psammosilenae]|uniref:phage tail assembly protein n=1 Tax=Aureimonas psammosilenae TaxID=2495496 RepID=UPI00126094C5|nr:phage tail assembly protein [Aureimonas psammosilenae]
MTTANYDKRTEVTISLEFPVDIDGEKYTALTLRRPKTKDVIAAEKFEGNSTERSVLLFARLCNVAPNVIEELDEIDGGAVNAQYRAFTGRQSA